MRNEETKLSSRILAGFLTMIMVLSLIPFSAIPAMAATAGHDDAVTITVTEEDGTTPIAGATVTITVVDAISEASVVDNVAKTTDANGVVEVMTSGDIGDFLTINGEGELTVSATVTADDHEDGSLAGTVINSPNDNYIVRLVSTKITDVTIVANTDLEYDGTAQSLVTVNEKPGDTVTYKLDGVDVSEPKAVDAGAYAVEVTVTRAGKDPLTVKFDGVENSKISIAQATTGIDITGKTLTYNEGNQALVTLTGTILGTDDVKWYVDGNLEEITDNKVPERMAVGNYTVRLVVDRGTNYIKVDKTVESEIQLAELNLGELSISANDLTYNGNDQRALTVENQGDYTLKYSFTKKDGSWVEYDNDASYPVVKDAKDYSIYVKAVKEGYNEKETPAFSIKVTVKPKTLVLSFVNEVKTSDPIEQVAPYTGVEYDFSANLSEDVSGTINYEIDSEKSDSGVASFDETVPGLLIVTKPGAISIKVTWSGSSNYTVEPLTHTLDVYSTGSGHVAFAGEPVDYVIGTNEGKAQEIEAQQTAQDDDGAISYEVVNGDTIGLLVDSDGKVTIGDYSKLVAAIQNANGTLSVRVKAKKAAVKNFFGREKFPADETSYTFNITFAATPEKTYDASGEHKGNSDWFTSAVVLTPTSGSGYTIARDAVDADGLNFGESCTFDNQGSATATQRYVYLRRADGGITDRIRVNDVNIDTEAPAAGKMSYKIQELSLIEKIDYKFGFFNPSVSITFFVEDELDEDESGLDHITWFYSKDASATHSIISDKSDDLPVEVKNGKYEATLTITVEELEQYRGHISFKAYDVAGNGGDVEIKQDENGDDIIVVVEKVSPEMSAEFKLADSNGVYNPIEVAPGVTRHYYNGSVDFTFTVEEANFFEDDVIINVTRDGEPYDVTVNWTKDSEAVTDPTKDELNYGKFTLTEDGDYVVTMSYKDQTDMVMVDADNVNSELDPYTSETITIDSVAPEISFVYNGKEDDNNNQSVTFTIVEHNFDPNSIECDFEANDITGKRISSYANQGAKLIQTLKGKLESVNWTHDGDSHSITIDDFADAVYNLKVRYKDLALNAYTTDGTPGNEEFETGEFIIDHTKPTNVEISYSDAYVNPWDTVVGILTLGFYNPKDNRPVTITFVTTDDTSGIDHFDWSYKRTDGVSEVKNLAELSGTIKDSDISRDGNTFTASITLPKDTADQLRGSITVSATDNKANKSETVTDSGKVIVVDSISPEMTVAYSESSRTLPSGEMLYNKAATATFTVTEANFFKEDVKVTVSKNGGTPYSVTPSWVDNSTDEHIGTLVLAAASDHSNDGHYVINVTYTDRSNNTMTSYKSNTITIDTIAPTIAVKYDDDKVPVVQTLEDNVHGNAANDRKYYADQKVATITVVEHNFDANEVDFTIVAKDITGTVLSSHSGPKPATDPNLIKFGTWSSSDDTHTITITYPGDANYEFDVAYTDLATNEAADYATGYFTVDKTAPTNITVDYSTSVLDTVLNSLTFGFYNAKMTVTITADDETSSVRSFLYNYRNAAGVSAVNAELINQALEEANGDIRYSNDGKTATISFEIPKMVLGNDNQFNGTVDFTATDRADNETKHEETKRLVVDNIAPTAQVAYNESTNKVGDIDYYNGNIDATVTITEANFYSDDVVITVTKDGAAYNVTPTWADNSVDVHVGRFTLTEDGDYIITINYRDKSSNTMTEYKSNQLTIDTKIEEPTYTINNVARSGDDGKAYKSDATVEFNFEDQNFDTKTITLTRKRYNDETVVYDSEKTGVNDFGVKLNMNDKGGSGTITIPEEVANDGIYTLKITMTDKALHPTESYVKFAITRFGSVYEYNDVLADLIKDGGQYVKSIEKDLIIKEYNAVPITNESLKITITRDGEAIDVDYTSDPTDGKQFETVGIGNSGWYEYVYTIKAANFAEDGVYNITLSSLYDALDASGNSVSTSSTSVPDNSIDADGNKVLDVMKFTVDDTAPEIRNVINLDKEIADRDQIIDGKLTVTYTIIDVGGLKTIEIIVNGSTLDTISEFEDASSYTGTFDLNESSDKQTVQIKVTDLAGNVTDTANDAFKNAHKTSDDPYVFNDTITVSTNFFVRWYANTPLFWGSIGGVVLVAGGSGAAIAAKRKKKAKA